MSTKQCRSSYSPASTTPSTVAGSAWSSGAHDRPRCRSDCPKHSPVCRQRDPMKKRARQRARRRAGWTPEITMIRAVLSTNEMQRGCTRTGKPVISSVKRLRALSQLECAPRGRRHRMLHEHEARSSYGSGPSRPVLGCVSSCRWTSIPEGARPMRPSGRRCRNGGDGTVTRRHSCRKASIGSTRDARRAGTQLANPAMVSAAMAISAKTPTSRGLTPNRKL